MSPPLRLRRSIGLSRRWLRYDLAALDPATDPVAFALDPRQAAGLALATALAGMDGRFVREGWLPRAKLVSALRQTSPLDAAALERAPATDVGRWTVLYAAEKVSLAIETFNELAALVLAPAPAGCAARLARCIDGGEHVWDAEVIVEEEEPDAEEGGELACSKCGVIEEFWAPMHREW